MEKVLLPGGLGASSPGIAGVSPSRIAGASSPALAGVSSRGAALASPSGIADASRTSMQYFDGNPLYRDACLQQMFPSFLSYSTAHLGLKHHVPLRSISIVAYCMEVPFFNRCTSRSSRTLPLVLAACVNAKWVHSEAITPICTPGQQTQYSTPLLFQYTILLWRGEGGEISLSYP